MRDFFGKRVVVMGLGLHGGGIATVQWLVKHGAKVTVTDLKTKEQLENSIKQLGEVAKKVNWVLGCHKKTDFQKSEMVVQSPGAPRNSIYLQIAKENNVLIENQASLFFKYCPATIIGVTGTRGKSTTSSLIYDMLVQKFKKDPKVWLVGLSQMPMLSVVDKIRKNDLVVAELSSWQLEVLGQHRLSPRIAVVTNLFEDHLNTYKSMAEYANAKKNIFLFQKQDNICVINYDNKDTKKMAREVVAKRIWISTKNIKDQNAVFVKQKKIYFRLNGYEKVICSEKVLRLKGCHNLYNAMTAMAVAGVLGVSSKQMIKAVINYRGLPGRVEEIGNIKGVKYINDTTATTPDAARVALEQMSRKNVILIAGGETKNISQKPYDNLALMISKKCKAVILLSGRGSEQIIKSLKKYNIKNLFTEIPNLVDALAIAEKSAGQGDIVLLSPACASFNMFVNEFDRGEQFNRLVFFIKNKK